jgi:hypothetical protein
MEIKKNIFHFSIGFFLSLFIFYLRRTDFLVILIEKVSVINYIFLGIIISSLIYLIFTKKYMVIFGIFTGLVIIIPFFVLGYCTLKGCSSGIQIIINNSDIIEKIYSTNVSEKCNGTFSCFDTYSTSKNSSVIMPIIIKINNEEYNFCDIDEIISSKEKINNISVIVNHNFKLEWWLSSDGQIKIDFPSYEKSFNSKKQTLRNRLNFEIYFIKNCTDNPELLYSIKNEKINYKVFYPNGKSCGDPCFSGTI